MTPMMPADLTAQLPHGWDGLVFLAPDGATIYIAVCAAREELRFESTSAVDLVDQVHEACDAWQTELELAGAAAATGLRRWS